ncbi:RDD family protein [Novipirellula artificiosorum]|uniref:RDD family protein n=1 Tax=Novipirellula artificiosorum TaxID=2528016 RepID=A0A5C6D976_9BACT|nr:RDD family protein [Novipirellula artificiosorum]TWU33298.1 RDD family protein [Novipirellula artificiosorum]
MSSGYDNPFAAPSETSTLSTDPSLSYELATRGERFAGALIDGLLMLPLVFGGGMALGVAMIAAGINPESLQFNLIATVVGGFLGAVVFLVINGYLLATKGQTVGKLIIKTQIVSESTNTILPFGQLVMLRYLPFWVAGSLPILSRFVPLIDALAIFRASRKCIHDDIAGTKVIKLSL